MTQLEYAKKNIVSPLVKKVAGTEGVPAKIILQRLKNGLIVIPLNINHKIKKPCAIGYGLRTKVNANIGTSTDKSDIKNELNKLKVAVKYGTDTIMDLSVGGDIKRIRSEILKASTVPVGTVPIYEIAVEAQNKKSNFLKFKGMINSLAVNHIIIFYLLSI